MNIFIVTYCSAYAEYGNQISLKKAFFTEAAAQKFANEKLAQEKAEAWVDGDKLGVWVGDYNVEEVELEEELND